MCLMSRSVLYLLQRSIICLAGCKSGWAVMFQTNWTGPQCSQVLAGTITCLLLELNLLQAGAGLEQLLKPLLTWLLLWWFCWGGTKTPMRAQLWLCSDRLLNQLNTSDFWAQLLELWRVFHRAHVGRWQWQVNPENGVGSCKVSVSAPIGSHGYVPPQISHLSLWHGARDKPTCFSELSLCLPSTHYVVTLLFVSLNLSCFP